MLAAPATTEDVPVIKITAVPAEAPCPHPSCAHADPATPCHCRQCVGAGHGWVTARRQEAARAKARVDREHRYGTDVFASIEVYIPDAPMVAAPALRRPGRGLAAIRFDADGWPID